MEISMYGQTDLRPSVQNSKYLQTKTQTHKQTHENKPGGSHEELNVTDGTI
jgi:hypothetical protein